jgi:hypothetical protein
MAIWNIWYLFQQFGNLVEAIWYIFPSFGILCQEKSGNPVFEPAMYAASGISN